VQNRSWLEGREEVGEEGAGGRNDPNTVYTCEKMNNDKKNSKNKSLAGDRA
jgi:hypothetical protein